MSKLLHLAPTDGKEAALKFRRQLWEDRDFTDVTLEVVGGEEIHCQCDSSSSQSCAEMESPEIQAEPDMHLEKEDSCSALVLKKLMEFIYIRVSAS